MSLAALTPCPLCLCRSLSILPSCLSSVPALSALSRQALAHLGPSLLPALVCRWRCQPRLAEPGPPAHAGPSLPLLRGCRRGEASYPRVSGPCPPAAEALQTHNALFQEHTAPSSPGAASSTRGFRRASEISIASQVSGMAESYTASSIAQSEFPPCTLPSVLQGAVCAPGNRWQCVDTAGEGAPLAPGEQRPGMLLDTL